MSSNDLSGLLLDTTFKDISFLCGDDSQPIHAHKNILSYRCEYFQKMFTVNMKEKNINEIKLPHIQRNHFFEVIRFIYIGKANLDVNNIAFIYALADQYCMDNLKNYCLLFPITIQNLIPLLQSCHIEAEPLYRNTLQYLESGRIDVKEILNSEEFLNISEGILQDILKEDIPVDEILIFQSVVKWAKHQLVMLNVI